MSPYSGEPTITELFLRDYARSRTIRSIGLVQGQVPDNPERWAVIVNDGQADRILVAKRGNVRSWASLDTLIAFLQDCGVPRSRLWMHL